MEQMKREGVTKPTSYKLKDLEQSSGYDPSWPKTPDKTTKNNTNDQRHKENRLGGTPKKSVRIDS